MTTSKKVNKNEETKKRKRAYLSQSDVPSFSLDQAIRIPQAIADHFAAKNATPLQLASALNVAPTSGPFRQLCGASIAYGLTEGGYNAQQISLLPLGKRVVRPLKEGDDLTAKREAILKPRILGEFLQKYNGSSLPRLDIAKNMLKEMGVPEDKTETVHKLIINGAQSVGLLKEIKNKRYVDLKGTTLPSDSKSSPLGDEEQNEGEDQELETSEELLDGDRNELLKDNSQVNRKVFITHGKNKSFINPIKKLLGFGELIPVVSVEQQSVSKPVPDKVMEDMRSCGAAIIHVEAEKKLIDKDANEHTSINPNVLIEIGAAMALYGRRFILLVREGVSLPSNLQGLYEVRYRGDSLDGDVTIKLLESINDIKNNPLPEKCIFKKK